MSITDLGENSPANFDTTKYRLGKLCKHGHDWNGTGQSLRKTNKSGECVECRNLVNKKYYKANCEREKERRKAYYEENHESIKERAKAYRQANCEEQKKRNKAYYEENHESIKERQKAYRETNYERIKERDKAFREANREKLNQRVRTYYEANRERCKQRLKAYREANREKIRECNRKYRQTHPRSRKEYDKAYRDRIKQSPERWEAQREHNRLYRKLNYATNAEYRANENGRIRKRRALKRQCHAVPYQAGQIETLKNKFNHQCAYCGSDSKLTIDHFIPLAKGGAECLGNFVPACKSCNSSKSDSDALEWYKRQPFYSEKRWKFILEVLGKSKGDYRQLPLF